MSISELYQIYQKHPVATTDSRNCPPGAVFFALKGESFDGNRFAANALDAGAAYAVIDDPEMKTDERMILTENVLQTLQQLACHHRTVLGTPVIGITGTNGKTTTKELAASVLSASYRLLYTQGNLNNHIGVPLTLLRLTHDHEMAVVEMGANHPDEIRALAEMARPDYGIITNVGYAHLEGFGSFDGVLRAKGELYDYLRHTNGKVFIHKENEYLQKIACGLEQISYGESDDAFVSGRATGCHPFLSLEWKRQKGHTHQIATRLAGNYNLYNVLAAIAVGCYFNVPAEAINRAIAGYEPSNNRSQWKKTVHNTLIIDAYNANPSSMDAALKNFVSLPVAPKVVILGDMLELGAESLRLHAAIVEKLKAYTFDSVFLCGNHFAAAGEIFPCFPDAGALKNHLANHPLKDCHILIKGSHGIHLERIVDCL
ncbi:MAG: UDP-N-acetylmuramoyl-tripeptide--D-alanyl-D-alanine ligase [Tannerella sp.]|jgi:UDP-N-acetylmuramoyl-tripeptide--D-alanyl-D-alanine ligase|nr:UDP-N-acetylmuramoyl-tripeptide--D-alanyl-D-alanine ligase [Tannerella sp.]